MDEFVFDLDKALDELEENEDKEEEHGSSGQHVNHDSDGTAGTGSACQPPCTLSLDYTDSSRDNYNNLNGLGLAVNKIGLDLTLEDRLGQNIDECDSAIKLDISEADFAPSASTSLNNSSHKNQEVTNIENGLNLSNSSLVTESNETSQVASFETTGQENGYYERDLEASPAIAADQNELHGVDLPSDISYTDSKTSHDRSSLDTDLTVTEPHSGNVESENVQTSMLEQREQCSLSTDRTPVVLSSGDEIHHFVEHSTDGQNIDVTVSSKEQSESYSDTDYGSHSSGSQMQDPDDLLQNQSISSGGHDEASSGSGVESSKQASMERESAVTAEKLPTVSAELSRGDKSLQPVEVSHETGLPSASSIKDDQINAETRMITELQNDQVSVAESSDVQMGNTSSDSCTTTDVVGFGDINDIDLSNDELDQYLSTIGGPDNCTEYDSKPVFAEEISINQGNTSYSLGTPLLANAVEREVSTAEQDVSDERRGSGGSVEKFLAPVVMSPSITTPIEDPGYSKVPGYIPELSITVEEESDDLEVKGERLHSAGSGELYSNSKSEEPKSNTFISTAPEDSSSQSEIMREGMMRTFKNSTEMGGARPKEPQGTSGRIGRPSSLLGLSTPDLPSLAPPQPSATVSSTSSARLQPAVSPGKTTTLSQVGMQFSDAVVRDSGIVADSAEVDSGTSSPKDEPLNMRNIHDLINTQLVAQSSLPVMKRQMNLEIKQINDISCSDIIVQEVTEQNTFLDTDFGALDSSLTCGTKSSGEQQIDTDHLVAPAAVPITGQSTSPKQKRPSSLNIISMSENQLSTELTPAENDVPVSADVVDTMPITPASCSAEQSIQDEMSDGPNPAPQTGSVGDVTATESVIPSPPTSANINLAITQLGKVAPLWVPDAEAPSCMQCEAKFTFTKRRHHCRACGKIFCNSCCNLRSKLAYMDNKEARVCSKCYQDLIRAQVYERRHQQSPNPNNPSEYCSTVPPLQQAAGALNAPPLTVMVPSGVLRKDGNQRRAEGPKQVMFSDGIRPGGDLTELDGISDQRPQIQRQTRKVYHVEKTDKDASSHTRMRSEQGKPVCLIPEQGLPPVLLSTGIKGDFSIEENPDPEKILPKIRSTEDPEPVVFAINKNLFVLVKIVTLDCCVNRVCWCFSTKGMSTVGQDDIVIVLECLPDEKTIPRDIFCHMGTVYEEASKGNTVSHLGHTIFAQGFLDSRDHSGFLYINASYQCLQKLILPQPPFIFGILLQRWETPWAKVFPIRLMLRLGAEYRYYPCPLISVRFRKPVFGEIGHTIMNLLADFRNYQYMLPQVPGVSIHMGDKETFINFPRNRYNNIMKVLTNSNDHVMALAANFSLKADSHLVCLQNEDGRYLTQAINIQNKPRKVTGASFVVFNGAFKQAGGIRAKSSIIEDGLMVQITARMMADLKEAMKSMLDYVIECGGLNSLEPEETITVRWVEDDNYVNIGIKSPIDSMPMDGIESIRIHTSTDFAGDKHMIRWTECFFVQTPTDSNSRDDPVDLSRLAESLAHAICVALAPHLDKLQSEHLSKIGLRATIDPDRTCYEVGSNGTRLPDEYMDVLDSALIPVIHNAASHNQDGPVILELIFHIIE